MVCTVYKLWRPGPYGEWIVAFTACLCGLTYGQILAWPAVALPKIRDGSAGFSITEDQVSWMVMIMFIANVLTPIPAGYVMDRMGRKNSLMVFDLLAVVSWIVTYYGRSAEVLYFGRAITGAWAGFVHTIVPVHIAEIVRLEIRGSTYGVVAIMTYTGGLMESLLGTYVSYSELALYSIIPPVLVFVIFLVLPESPYYHLMKGNREQVVATMEWLRGKCDTDALGKMEESVKEQLHNRGTFLDILKVEHLRRAFIIVETVAFLQRLAGMSVLVSYGTLIIPDSFLTGEESFTALNVSWLIGSTVSYFLLDELPRRAVLAVSCYGSGVSILAASLWFLLRDYTEIDTSASNYLPIVFIFCYGIFFAFGLMSVPHVIQGEMYPINVKGKASALAIVTSAISSSIVLRLYRPIDELGGVSANLFVASVFSIILGTFALTCMLETRGKSLEIIQEELICKKKRKIYKSDPT